MRASRSGLLALLAALALSGPTHVAGEPMVTSGPACKAVPASFVNVISKMPAPPADALCSWLLRGNASLITTCDGLAIVETGLSKDTSRQACDPGAQAAYPLTGGPTPLADARPLPPGDFDDVPATYAAEGATYHWLYSLVRRLEDWLPCAAEGRAWPPPPGWLLVRELTLDEGGAQPLLFGVVLASEDGGQLVVAVRGTMTAYEWGLDWQYNQTAATPDLFDGVPLHAGFGEAFSQVWPDVEAALEEMVVTNATNGSVPQVYVTGHSLGAAVATLVAHAAQGYLDAELGEGAAVVDAVLVAPPNVGPPQFVESFNGLVNARRLAFQYDIVPQAFCMPEMPACSGAAGGSSSIVASLLQKAGVAVVPTNEPGNVSAWSYAQIGGSLPIAGDDMPQDTASWPALQNVQFCWATQFLLATHVCSYSCFTSQFSPDPAASNCWLSPQPAGTQGSACMGWPAAYPGVAQAAAPSPA